MEGTGDGFVLASHARGWRLSRLKLRNGIGRRGEGMAVGHRPGSGLVQHRHGDVRAGELREPAFDADGLLLWAIDRDFLELEFAASVYR